MPEIRRVCSCGTSYARSEWSALRLVGLMEVEDVLLELRNCRCGSTISVSRRMTAQLARAVRAVTRSGELVRETRRLLAEVRESRRVLTAD